MSQPEWTPYEEALLAQADRQITSDCSHFYFPPAIEEELLPDLAELDAQHHRFVTNDGMVIDPFSGEVLEDETEALAQGMRKARAGKFYASALAERLVGSPISLGTSEDGETILLGAEGEELQAEPGEGKIWRGAALLLLEADTPWIAVGKRKDADGKPMPNSESFGIGGSGYAPGFKLSPGYQRKHSAMSRKESRLMLELLQKRLRSVSYDQSKVAGGEIRSFALALTSPTIDPALLPSGLSVTEELEEKRLFCAWALLRKRKLWIDNVFGGFRGYEITRRWFDDGMLFHPHFHLLLYGKYIDQWALAQEWWGCLRTATMEVYGGFDIADLYDADKSFDRDSASKWSKASEARFKDRTELEWAITASAYIQAIRRRAKPGAVRDELGHRDGPTTLETALQETLKYMTKADKIATYERDLERNGEMRATGLPTEYLQGEIFRRSCQIFAKLGAARSTWTLPEWCEMAKGVSQSVIDELLGEATKRAAKQLREARLLDAQRAKEASGELLAAKAAYWGREAFYAQQRAAIALRIENDVDAPEKSRQLAGEARREADLALEGAISCLLDTPGISDGGPDGTTDTKRHTLRSLMDTMSLHSWLQIAAKRAFNSLEHLQDALRNKGYFVPDFASVQGASPG